MSRSSRKKAPSNSHPRPLLTDAMKEGIIDLHFQQQREIFGSQRSVFLVETGVAFQSTLTGGKKSTLTLIMTYVADQDKAKIVGARIKKALKEKNPWQSEWFHGAFWIVLILRKKKLVDQGLRVIKRLAIAGTMFGLLIYAAVNPDALAIVHEILKYLGR